MLREDVSAQLDRSVLIIKGPQGEVRRDFHYPSISLSIVQGKIEGKAGGENGGKTGKKIIVTAEKASKKEKTIVGTFTAHIRNLVNGVQQQHVYKLKICSGHFPMTVTVAGQELLIKNFLGESVPRRISLEPGVSVKIQDKDIIVSSPDKELAGKTAAGIEQACRITNRDRRIFMDGIWLTEKAGKAVS